MRPSIDFSQTDGQPHSFGFSVLTLGCGAVLFFYSLPFTPAANVAPLPGQEFWAWFAGGTVLFGVAALIRRERGLLALASAMVTVAVILLLVFVVVVGGGSAVLMRVFMSD